MSRPANLVTAVADIMAGISIAGFIDHFQHQPDPVSIAWLSLATIGLYGGGIVFNDVFDAEIDAIERPERAIPKGIISVSQATAYALVLFAAGIAAAFAVSVISGLIAFAVAVLALFYNKFGKHHSFFGPLNMGLCRGGNLLLGVSIINPTLEEAWWLGIVPVVYIAAITMVSRGEVHGGSKQTLWFAGFLYILVDAFQLLMAFRSGNFYIALPFVLLHLYLVFKPLLKAIENPVGPNIGKAVKGGVLALIVMDAVWVGVGGNYLNALLVLALLPVSIWLAKLFAVT
ncbi:UbiA-like protein EboC [Emticicia sp. CRIBPO]|nr:UbiA-like protein EboC [Emticicia sp. CRIBPO]